MAEAQRDHWQILGILAILAVALSLRLLLASQSVQSPLLHATVSDTRLFDELAQLVLQGDLTNESFDYLNPLYPFFLAFIHLGFGHGLLAVLVIQGILDTLSCLLVYVVGSSLMDRRVGLIAALAYACYGIAIFYSGLILATTLATFFLLLALATLIAAVRTESRLLFFNAGVFLGILGLARPNAALLLPVLPLWLLRSRDLRGSVRRRAPALLLLVLGISLPLGATAARNFVKDRRLSPFSAVGGINFYHGNNPRAAGTSAVAPGVSTSPGLLVETSILQAERDLGRELSPSEASSYWLAQGLRYLWDHPGRALVLYVQKGILLLRKEEIPLNVSYELSRDLIPMMRWPFLSFGLVAPFALVGMALAWREGRAQLPLVLTLTYMLSILLFFNAARYRLPIVPVLMIFGADALLRIFHRETPGGGRIRLGIAAAVLLLLVNVETSLFTVRTTTHRVKLGRALMAQGQVDRAVAELEQAVEEDGGSYDAWVSLGAACAQRGQHDRALQTLAAAAAMWPDRPEAHLELARIHLRSGDRDQASTSAQKALDLGYPLPADLETRLGLESP